MDASWELFFLLLAQSAHLFLHTCISPHTTSMAWLRFFPNSYATTGNQTHVSSVAPVWGTLTQDALPTELTQPRQRFWTSWKWTWSLFYNCFVWDWAIKLKRLKYRPNTCNAFHQKFQTLLREEQKSYFYFQSDTRVRQMNYWTCSRCCWERLARLEFSSESVFRPSHCQQLLRNH